MEIAKLVLQAIAVFLTLAALGYTILSAWMKKIEKEAVATRDETLAAVNRISADLNLERTNRVDNINRLHERVDEMQSELISDLTGRISRIEGELVGMNNILKSIQGWFINQAGLGKKD